MSYDNIPEELRIRKQWVSALNYGKAGLTPSQQKIPFNPVTRQPASVTDPSTWGTFEEAVATGFPVGYVLSSNDPYCFIDLDEPLTEEQKQRHTAICNTLKSYSEASISGKGAHIIVKASIPKGARRDRVEVYSSARYMICTGKRFGLFDEIYDRQDIVDAMYQQISGQKPPPVNPVNHGDDETVRDDDALLQIAFDAENGEKFAKLYEGDWKDSYPSQSEADYALLSILVYYSSSDAQVKRLFLRSALGKRKKAQREDYVDHGIARLRSDHFRSVDISKMLCASRRHLALKRLPSLLVRLAKDCERVYGMPCYFTVSVALSAIASSLGKGLFFIDKDQRTYPNLYFLLMANSGVGKSRIYRKLISPIQQYEHQLIESFVNDQLPQIEAEIAICLASEKKLTRAENIQELAATRRKLKELENQRIEPALYVEDSTSQKLVEQLSRDEQLLVCSSDSKAVIDIILGRYNDGKTDEAIFLQGHSIEPWKSSRIIRGVTSLKAPCINLLLVGTNDLLTELIRNERLLRGGFLPRVIIVSGTVRPKIDTGTNDKLDEALWHEWDCFLRTLIECYRLSAEEHEVQLSPEAREVFRLYWNEYASSGTHSEILEPFLCRHCEMAKRLSLSFHTLAYQESAHLHSMSGETAKQSVELMRFYADIQLHELHKVIRRKESEQSERIEKKTRECIQCNGGQITLAKLKKNHGFNDDEIELLRSLPCFEIFDANTSSKGGKKSPSVRLAAPE